MLERYSDPRDLKRYSLQDLKKLAEDVRRKIIQTVAVNGGHLASSLGAVELAIALHAALDTPQDKLIWDVGHQAYAHKILTGRLAKLETLRRYNGLSGFPKREESVYDTLTVGHASTSVSAAVGLAQARDIQAQDFAVVSVVGDGAFSGGMIFEALNNAQNLRKFVVILNDNGMSIGKPVGTLARMITNLRLSNFYRAFKKQTEFMIGLIPAIGKPLRNAVDKLVSRTGGIIIQELAKRQKAGFFQDLGLTYFGPLDGHNISLLTVALKYAKDYERPVLLHVLTKKGKGYAPAEKEPSKFHGVAGFAIETGASPPAERSYTQVFGEELLRQAARDKKICAVTAAMADGTGLDIFAKKYPKRFFDVGIAEEHAVTFSAGLAAGGLQPVTAIYSTFLQRGYDQIIHDAALQKLPLFLAVDRAGLVGSDGPTHHGVFDLSFLRTVPGLVLAAPKDANELKDLIKLGLASQKLFALRYPRGAAWFSAEERAAQDLTLGQAEIVYGQAGAETVVWAIGTMVRQALQAVALLKGQGSLCIVNARFAAPLDKDLLRETATSARRIITVEENIISGGFGAAVAEALAELGISVPQTYCGVPKTFVGQGTVAQLYQDCGLDAAALAKVFHA
ncbi:1-deoxy-D-xylulose-5-phosphate synthase [Candidatus Termititenax persephonae]|uniref:1-deoxy-D-xylulose-5-phosphate synthase n=1 Tax=Candidatus Termititenax persephonae TaxID=2218525 RepID=A0A388TIV6_9BACT|nr:1-deoxy-D-xylulose-5-phosphate synthase [Candidatus Termititenax persephonae]